MPVWEPFAHRRAALTKVQARLLAGETGADLMLAHADLLAQLGQADAAQAAYLALLRSWPGHLAGLNNFAALVHGQGYASAARTLYAEAARQHPRDPMSQVNLGGSLMEIGDGEGAQAAFAAALAVDPDFGPAHRGLARLAAERGDPAGCERHLAAAFARSAVIEQPYVGAGPPIEVLLLISGQPADIPLRQVLDPAIFKVTALAPAYFDPAAALPPHHLVFNAIGDADQCAEALEAAATLTALTQRPVINAPAKVIPTGRVAIGRRLAALPGVIAAASVEISRDLAVVADAAAITALGLRFPIALRAAGFHTGQHFERIDTIADLAPAAARMPGERLLAMDFVDTRSADGLYRKYRVMVVGGALYPLHLAVSPHWKVHYFTAGMEQRADLRDEDAAFLADMQGVIGASAVAALEQVCLALGLDYGGIDFTLTPAGQVLVFEANATMLVHRELERGPLAHKNPAVETICAAFQALLSR